MSSFGHTVTYNVHLFSTFTLCLLKLHYRGPPTKYATQNEQLENMSKHGRGFFPMVHSTDFVHRRTCLWLFPVTSQDCCSVNTDSCTRVVCWWTGWRLLFSLCGIRYLMWCGEKKRKKNDLAASDNAVVSHSVLCIDCCPKQIFPTGSSSCFSPGKPATTVTESCYPINPKRLRNLCRI